MPLYNLSDHLHYERNDPGAQQSVYFNVSPEFVTKMVKTIDTATQRLHAEGVTDFVEGLKKIRGALTYEFGQFTLPELLCITHYISAQIAFETGMEMGYQKGLSRFANDMNVN